MNYVHIPNLPQGPVRLAVADGRISSGIEEGLTGLGIRIIKTHKLSDVYDAVSYHPDIMMHHVGDEYIVYAPGVHTDMLSALLACGFRLIKGDTPVGDKYPDNIAYNAARIGNRVFHNLMHTDPVLKRELERRGVEFVHVKQGYTKCSVSIVDENSIITADKGIAGAAMTKGMDVLLIQPEDHILLPGLDNGFIGGSTGLLGCGRWACSGSIERLKSKDRIIEFLKAKDMTPTFLSDEQIIDIGSVIPLGIK